MKTNQSNLERVLRAILGVVLLVLGWGGFVSGAWGIVLIVLGFIALITGLVGFCPLYALLKISTKKS